jgi:membrane fusion protein, multidrug efflux system
MKTHPLLRFVALATVLAGMALGHIGCQKHDVGSPQAGGNVPPAKVNLKRRVDLCLAEKRTLQDSVSTVGVLEAEGETAIPAGVSGIVDDVYFREGDEVTVATVLLTIDQKRFVASAEVARANEKRAEGALAIAKDAADRVRTPRSGVSDEERTRLLLQHEVAIAEHRASQAQRQLAERNLELSRVKPRYSGRINSRPVTQGMYVEEKTTVATIAETQRLRLVAYVPERAANMVRSRLREQRYCLAVEMLAFPGTALAGTGPQPVSFLGELLVADQAPTRYTVRFQVPAFPDQTFDARLFHLGTVASRETHMFESKSEVMQPNAGSGLQPGYSAKLRFPLRTLANAVVIPEESIRPNEKGFIVFVPEERRTKQGQIEWIARARRVEIGLRPPGWVEIRDGLKAGERVVQRGAAALEDGTPIQFDEPTAKGG